VTAVLGHGLSALILPLPEAEEVVPGGYIALVSPFVPRHRIDDVLVERARRIVSRIEPFDFTLARVGRFPQGVLYIAPEPAEPFVELVRAFWPEYPPYEGEYDSVVPHLTVWFAGLVPLLTTGSDPEPPGLADAVARALPIRATATHVDLAVMGPRLRWSRRARFPLGG
jgi:hypothetical protein